jgi:valyl-tRNA synthetase
MKPVWQNGKQVFVDDYGNIIVPGKTIEETKVIPPAPKPAPTQLPSQSGQLSKGQDKQQTPSRDVMDEWLNSEIADGSGLKWKYALSFVGFLLLATGGGGKR